MKKRGKRQTLPICAVVLAGLLIPTSATAVNFEDVPAGRWYAEPITWAVEQAIASGTSKTTFSPNETCNKAQVLAFLWRGCGSPSVERENSFTDINGDKYYYKAALWAYENGMVSGGRFDPQAPCTRSMAVTYMWKTAGSPQAENAVPFADVRDSADYAQAVAWAIDTGVTSGTSETTFSPEQTCTRAQVMAFIYRSRNLYGVLNQTEIEEQMEDPVYESEPIYRDSWAVEETNEKDEFPKQPRDDDLESDGAVDSEGTLEPLSLREIEKALGSEVVSDEEVDIEIVWQ